jgi:Domain of unknown function (DUF3806)
MRTILCLMLIINVIGCSTRHKKYGDISEKDYKHEYDTVEGDTIYYKTAITENESQKFIELSLNDKIFLNNCRLSADSMLRNKFPGKSINNFTPKDLDNLIDIYNSNGMNCNQNNFVNSVGVAIGDYFVNKLGMRWINVEDDSGRDYAVTIDNIKLTDFPLNSVLKAIEQKRQGSLKTIYLMTLKDKAELSQKQ